MKKIITLCGVIFLLLWGSNVRANHIYGGDLLYTHLSGNSYKITLTLYGDCGTNNPTAFNSLFTATPSIAVYNGNTAYNSISLSLEANSAIDVTPACSSQKNNTACNGGTLPGIKQFIYSATVTLTGQSADWRFIFSGALGSNSVAGRSSNITNIVNPSGSPSTMYLEAMLNNQVTSNSSPQYTSVPTPFGCINTQQQYNQGAVDPDNDSLSFSLVPALSNGVPVAYNSGYSGTLPISCAPGNFSYNNLNGQMSFVPNQGQDALVVNTVYEYKNGVLVGSSMREMTFIVFNVCNNHPPLGNVSSSSTVGGTTTGNNVITICQGTPQVSFAINPTDPDGDTIYVSPVGVPAGATLTVSGNNTTTPLINFSWNTAALTPGNYNFYITYRDNGCPLSTQQTIAYTVQVVTPPQMTATVIAPTQCDHKALIRMFLTGGLIPRTLILKQGATTVKNYTDSTGIITDSIAAGNYTVILNSLTAPCAATQSLIISDSGQYPHLPSATSPVYYCKGDVPAILQATGTTGSSIIHWYDSLGNALSAPPVPSTATSGIFTWYVSQQKDVCESAKKPVQVYVTTQPSASISGPATLCTSDTASFSFNGTAGSAAVFNWSWNNPQYLSGAEAGPYAVQWDTAGTKTITLTVTENFCASAPVITTVNVRPTPQAVFAFHNICQYDSLQLVYNVAPLAGTQYTWDYDGGYASSAAGIGPHTVHWPSSGDKYVGLQVTLNGCTDSVRNKVTVYPQALVQIINTPQTLCYGDKVYLLASTTGGDSLALTWLPSASILHDPNGLAYTHVTQPSAFIAVVTNEHGCVNTDTIKYANVEPCCKFSYPDAFSPNGDGRNDNFHVVTYGNDEKYWLSIYNRWGDRVFVSFSQQDSWDGTFNGKPCDAGVYFYYFKGKCSTGQNEEHKGEVTLVR
ncbi:gliding motility-associated C-terminal domain-containing protein [Chitinophagaceae bacterium MMS25-I14]